MGTINSISKIISSSVPAPPWHYSTSCSIHIMLTYLNYSQLSGTWAGSDGGKGQERNSPEAETETSAIFAKICI